MDSQEAIAQPKGKLAQLLGGAKKDRNRIILEDSEGNDIGVAVQYDDFDGQTKLNYDNRVEPRAAASRQQTGQRFTGFARMAVQAQVLEDRRP